MKIGVCFSLFNNSYSRWGEDRYKKVKEHGFSCIDFAMTDTSTVIYTLPVEEADKFIKNERRLVEEAGLEVSQVHGPWGPDAWEVSEEKRPRLMEKMKRSIRETAMLGCKNWVVHPLVMPNGWEDRGTELEKLTWDTNIAFMKELLQTAKEYDVTICLENLPCQGVSLAKPEETLKFIKAINDDHFKMCLDTGHANVYGLSLRDTVLSVKDELRVLHVHDNEEGYDLHLFPGFGTIDWDEFAKALKEIDFQGVFSIEVHVKSKYPDDIFEELSKTLAKIGKMIMKER